MPWEESCAMDQRVRFIDHLTREWSMTELCERYEISRKTGYKWLDRYGEFGACGLMERSEPRWCMAGRRRLRLLRRS